ncbi:tripartite tricarboxylate transporter substrate binding protein [Bradyrhizobium sp. LHD-71]|uniref:Bug family tripartite tricarboxylate transporter substrate binding protein n=1 Tax=Bradyrhizobium sp. LHD-71 TaxID=3072141 RepID=UPI00280D4457|nr:tripartite tricarboxylate transporter substrate binding protein [Bradyrhizobium sp. LHD-71]MDQ8729431.1 tripartite tricarboxylate transporter substrate binding protein [Bradyrhizobium sp. LHD-71]
MASIGRRGFIAGAAAGLTMAGAMAPSRAMAQGNWPGRNVHFIVPLAPGGAIDFIARQVGDVLTRTLGQQVVVENRTGAGGTLGMDLAMKSEPDGYTVLITNDNAASAPHIMGLAHDYTKELVPVCYLGRQSQILAVHSTLGVKNVAELIAHVKANPGLGFATSGVGTNQHVVGEWFKREAGIRLDHVPYRGAGQAINDLIAAHVKIAFLGPTALKPHYDAGTLRLLAQSASARSPILKDVPTLEEAGFKGMVLDAWYGAFVPKGTPPAIIARLNSEMNKALTDPKLLENFTKGVVEPIGGTPEDLGKVARADSEKYARLIKELGIKAS